MYQSETDAFERSRRRASWRMKKILRSETFYIVFPPKNLASRSKRAKEREKRLSSGKFWSQVVWRVFSASDVGFHPPCAAALAPLKADTKLPLIHTHFVMCTFNLSPSR